MRRFWVIAGWEFKRYLRSRSFLLSTFISPIIFAGLIFIPAMYYENSQTSQDQVIGCVEFDTTSYCQLISERLTGNIDLRDGNAPRILLEPIVPDTTAQLRDDFRNLLVAQHRLDSLDEAYNKVKERRKYHFQRSDSPTKTQLLSKSYEEMISTRELRDLAEIEYSRLQSKVDTMVEKAVLGKADSLLQVKRISGYLRIDPGTFQQGVVEFHSEQPINFLRLQPLEQVLQGILVEERMRGEGITVNKIQELLQPIMIQELLLEGSQKHEFKFMVTYLAPVIAILFLFVGIFTSSGFLFRSIVDEKSERVVESLLSSASSFQLVGGKIFGLGLLGLFQVLIWMSMAGLLILINLIPVKDIILLTFENAGLFLLYFLLGYLLFAAIYAGTASVSVNRHDAFQLGQMVRILSLFPLALAILVLLSPNSMLVRFLSFVPFLSPTFMLLRTPLGQPPLLDYYISIGVMLVFIILAVLFAGKIYRAASLIYRKRPSLKSIMEYIHFS